MYSNTGIIQGTYSIQHDRVDEINERIFSRYHPDTSLRPNYDPRPVSTKYTIFQSIDVKTSTDHLGEGSTLDLDNSGFVSAATNGQTIRNIDTETILRNQTTALQHGIGQHAFVPSSNSDLFKTYIESKPSEQPFPNLFTTPTFSSNTPTIVNQSIGKSKFHNFTRNQLLDTMDK